MNTENETVYSIGLQSGTMYITHNSEHNEARVVGGRTVTITRERLQDFMHTARLLGMKAEEMR